MPLFPRVSRASFAPVYFYLTRELTIVAGNDGVKFTWCVLTMCEEPESTVMVNNSIYFQHSKSLSFGLSLLV